MRLLRPGVTLITMPESRPLPAPLATVLRHVTGLSPFGPVFGKELRTTARRKRSYLLRVLYLAGLLLAMLTAWAETSSRNAFGSVAARTQAQSELGRNFFMSFCVFSVVAMAALGPVLTCTAVSAERLGKTLHVLLMTPITAWQIVAGKLFSRLLVALTLLGLSLPVLALVRLLGGVELWQMAGIVCVCAATALAAAAIGLLLSTFMNRAYAVILLSYAAMLFLYAFIPFVLMAGLGMRFMPWFRIFTACNPFVCAGMIGEPSAVMMFGTAWVSCVLVHLSFAGLLVMASAAALRRVARKAGGGTSTSEPADASPARDYGSPADAPAAPATATSTVNGTANADGTATVTAGTTAAAIANTGAGPDADLPAARVPAPQRRRPPAGRGREVSDHPVLWREVRRPLMARRWQSVAAGVVSVALLLVTYAVIDSNAGLNHRDTHRGYGVVFNGLLWLLTAVLSATAIAQEKESDTWTLLLTTPLSGRSIVWGKVLGLYRRVGWPFALFAGHLLLFGVAGVIDLTGALLAVWVMFSFNTVWVATGLYLSLRVQKVTFAVIVNLLLAVLAYLGVAAVLVIVGETVGARQLSENVGWYLPYYYIVIGMTHGWPYWGRDTMYMPGHVAVTYEEFRLIGTLVGVAHVILAAVILSATAAAFDRIVGRAGGKQMLNAK